MSADDDVCGRETAQKIDICPRSKASRANVTLLCFPFFHRFCFLSAEIIGGQMSI